jgi:hypothetical protein
MAMEGMDLDYTNVIFGVTMLNEMAREITCSHKELFIRMGVG